MTALCEAVGRTEEAATFRARADVVRAEATVNVAGQLLFHGDIKRARECCERALALDTDCLKAHWLLGDIRFRDDDRDAALAHYRRCREIAPERLGPGFLMAALGEGDMPDRAPADFVASQFDWYAESFDTHLVETLLYRGPEEFVRLLRPIIGDRAPTILDLGCGTGLFGLEAAGLAGRLVGVDLSSGMLAKATERGFYDELVECDIVAFLDGQLASSVDIAVAVDVVVYIGDLGPLFPAVARVLCPGSAFAFSTERWNAEDGAPATVSPETPGWRLRPSGRYQHARAYIRELAESAGFETVSIEDRVLRYELGLPVDSDVVLLRKPQ